MNGFKVFSKTVHFETRRESEFVDLTQQAQEAVQESGVREGVLIAFAPHATGVLVINENEPLLLEDVREALSRLFPEEGHRHPANCHSHLKSLFLCPSRIIPVTGGKLALGTWQSLLFMEADTHGRRRSILLRVIGSYG